MCSVFLQYIHAIPNSFTTKITSVRDITLYASIKSNKLSVNIRVLRKSGKLIPGKFLDC